jgi:hypothetical protein
MPTLALQKATTAVAPPPAVVEEVSSQQVMTDVAEWWVHVLLHETELERYDVMETVIPHLPTPFDANGSLATRLRALALWQEVLTHCRLKLQGDFAMLYDKLLLLSTSRKTDQVEGCMKALKVHEQLAHLHGGLSSDSSDNSPSTVALQFEAESVASQYKAELQSVFLGKTIPEALLGLVKEVDDAATIRQDIETMVNDSNHIYSYSTLQLRMQEMLLNWIETTLDTPELVRLGYRLPKPETAAEPEAATATTAATTATTAATTATTATTETTAEKAIPVEAVKATRPSRKTRSKAAHGGKGKNVAPARITRSKANQTTTSLEDQVDGRKEPDEENEEEEEEEEEERDDEAKEKEVVEEKGKDREPQKQATEKDGDESEDSEETEVPTAAKTTSKIIRSALSFTSGSDTEEETNHPPPTRKRRRPKVSLSSNKQALKRRRREFAPPVIVWPDSSDDDDDEFEVPQFKVPRRRRPASARSVSSHRSSAGSHPKQQQQQRAHVSVKSPSPRAHVSVKSPSPTRPIHVGTGAYQGLRRRFTQDEEKGTLLVVA